MMAVGSLCSTHEGFTLPPARKNHGMAVHSVGWRSTNFYYSRHMPDTPEVPLEGGALDRNGQSLQLPNQHDMKFIPVSKVLTLGEECIIGHPRPKRRSHSAWEE